MRMVFQMTINLLADTADMLQPFVEADFVFCLLRNGNNHAAYRPGRNGVANQHHLAVTAAHYIINNSTERGFRAIGCPVVHTHNDLTAIVFVHRMQDAARDVSAHAVER